MAILANQDKDQDPNAQQAQGQQQSAQPGGDASSAFGGSAGVASNTAGVGAGGQGQWTNIQSYLFANQGDQSSANALKNQVGSRFDQDYSNAQQQSGQAKSQAQGQVDQSKQYQDQASKLVQQAGQQYTYGGAQPQAYQQSEDQLKGLMNQQYQGPQNFYAGMGSDTQAYGDELGNDQGFNALMQNVYRNAAPGGSIGSGELALQRQLDTNNPYVNQAHQDLLGQYGGLQQNLGAINQDTNQAISQAKDAYQKNNLQDYLSGMADQRGGQLDQAISAWNEAEKPYQNVGTSQYVDDPSQYVTEGRAPGQGELSHRLWDVRDQAPDLIQHYFDYVPGKADRSNVTGEGVDQARNEFNAIQEALGSGNLLNKGEAQHGGYRFNKDRLNDPNDLTWRDPRYWDYFYR